MQEQFKARNNFYHFEDLNIRNFRKRNILYARISKSHLLLINFYVTMAKNNDISAKMRKRTRFPLDPWVPGRPLAPICPWKKANNKITLNCYNVLTSFACTKKLGYSNIFLNQQNWNFLKLMPHGKVKEDFKLYNASILIHWVSALQSLLHVHPIPKYISPISMTDETK